MKKSLSELTMAQYVDLVCGVDVLSLPGEALLRPIEFQRAKARIMFEYHHLADPSGTASMLSGKEDAEKVKMTTMFFSVCHNLVILKAYDELKEALTIYGLDVEHYDNDRLAAEVDRQWKHAQSEERRLAMMPKEPSSAEGTSDPRKVRVEFDRQAAFLMTYFKFQIDMATIKATTFAMMLDQANREIKAKQKALNRH